MRQGVGGSGDVVLTFSATGSVTSSAEFTYEGGSTLNADLEADGQFAFQVSITSADPHATLEIEAEMGAGESWQRSRWSPPTPITVPAVYTFPYEELWGPPQGSFSDFDRITVTLRPTINGTASYTIGEIRTIVEMTADFNGDYFVNGDNSLIWQASFGVDAGGDADGDNDTDGDDFLAWQTQFNLDSGSASATVPEAASVGRCDRRHLEACRPGGS